MTVTLNISIFNGDEQVETKIVNFSKDEFTILNFDYQNQETYNNILSIENNLSTNDSILSKFFEIYKILMESKELKYQCKLSMSYNDIEQLNSKEIKNFSYTLVESEEDQELTIERLIFRL